MNICRSLVTSCIVVVDLLDATINDGKNLLLGQFGKFGKATLCQRQIRLPQLANVRISLAECVVHFVVGGL